MKVFYDKDADLGALKNETIGVIGYGIQGRAQALNLRDSGFEVIVGNVDDKYMATAQEDGFKVHTIAEVAQKASVLLFLIPDQAQKECFEKHIRQGLVEGNLLMFAHGYSLYYNALEIPANIDVGLMAPRMPGEPIRDYYLKGGGVPVFVDVAQDYTGKAWNKVLALAKGIGATKAGAFQVSYRHETEIDLFIEQFLLPSIIQGIRLSFDELNKLGIPKEALIMELFGSGEIGELLLKSAREGLYEVWKNHASPTCQYGIVRNTEKVLPLGPTQKLIAQVLGEIRDGTFHKALNSEASEGYPKLKAYNENNAKSEFTTAFKEVGEAIRFRMHQE